MTSKLAPSIKLGLLSLITCAIITGCGGEGDSSADNSLAATDYTSEQVTLSAQDATFSTGFTDSYYVDLSGDVYSSTGGGFVVTDVELLSDSDQCEVTQVTSTGFAIEAGDPKVCNYRYHVAPRALSAQNRSAMAEQPVAMSEEPVAMSSSSTTSAVTRVAVSSDPTTTELPALSSVTLIDTPITIDLASELASIGFAVDSGYVISDITLPYGNASTANIGASPNTINYTPAVGFTGIDRLLYTLEESASGNVMMGLVDIAVGYEANQGFSVEQNGEYGSPVEVNTIVDIDVSDFVTSEDGDDYQLVYVSSFNASVTPKYPLDINNKTIEFTTDRAGYHYISFAVSDHNGAYDMGMIRVDVTDASKSASWNDVTYMADLYTAPLTAFDAAREGIPFDSIVIDSGYSPAIDMAAFKFSTATNYCATIGASVPSKTQLQVMTANVNLETLHNWPAESAYIAFDDDAGQPVWVELSDGVAQTGALDPTGSYYLTCVKQGVINIISGSDSVVVADGVDVADVFVQVNVGGEALPDAIVTATVDSPNVTLESDTLTTNASGMAVIKMTSFKAETVVLTIDVNGILQDYSVMFVGDETTASVSSETTINDLGYESIGNQVTATLTDQNSNPVEGFNVEFSSNSILHPTLGFYVAPLIVADGGELTDSEGSQRVRVKWDPTIEMPIQSVTFDISSDYTNSMGLSSNSTSEITFSSLICGGVVNDTTPNNTSGPCIKVSSDQDGDLLTSTPSEAFSDRLGFTSIGNNYLKDDTWETNGVTIEGDYPVYGMSDIEAICEKYNDLQLAGRTNWRIPTTDDFLKMNNIAYKHYWPINYWYHTVEASTGTPMIVTLRGENGGTDYTQSSDMDSLAWFSCHSSS
ncbi:hypothetical protein F0231_20630 [Vibrio sp. RE86]|uniref:hypothetical protein n=1 Tax=Vibrio sp. RE86 TaxID=2607605 RepID=UPI001493570E|nr:hypothetical protein [Vibrio sp. RE86]NOH82124.1 hypothetical protein [Vibrio sp. RE86]